MPETGSQARRPLGLAAQAKSLALAVVLVGGLAGCAPGEAPREAGSGPTAPVSMDKLAAAPAPGASTAPTDASTPREMRGPKVSDSFGNVDFYTTVAGDTFASMTAAFGLSEAKITEFNGLTRGAPLVAGRKLRLIPAEGPLRGASGTATVDANGIPLTYDVAADDTLDGIAYRFGITEEQLAEANKVPYVHEQGNVYFLKRGTRILLQKNPVDSRSGAGEIVPNSFGHADFYTTVAGDSLDSLGYKFRRTEPQLLLYNPALKADQPIPPGTRVKLMAGDVTITGAQGTFTADAAGIPLTYTTAAGDIERQVALRFNLEIHELESANRPLAPGERTWFAFADLPAGKLVPGQVISLTVEHPINR